jgi:hypothetical protein
MDSQSIFCIVTGVVVIFVSLTLFTDLFNHKKCNCQDMVLREEDRNATFSSTITTNFHNVPICCNEEMYLLTKGYENFYYYCMKCHKQEEIKNEEV